MPAAGSQRRSGSGSRRLGRRGFVCAAAALSAALPGVAGELRGAAVLSRPFPLPEGAVLDVQLIEQDAGGDKGRVVLRGRSRSSVAGSAPYPFALTYLDGTIQPSGRYRLRASIQQGDRLLFSTAMPVPVLGAHKPPDRLSLGAVGDAPLRGLLWLTAPAASVPTPPGAPRQEQQIRLDPLSRELIGSADCNRFIGSFTLQGDALRLEPAGSTMLDCEPEVKADEARFIADLRRVRRWDLDAQGRLELLDQDGTRLLLMEPRPR